MHSQGTNKMDTDEYSSVCVSEPVRKEQLKIVHLGNQLSRWIEVKTQNALKTNEDVAKILLDRYYIYYSVNIDPFKINEYPLFGRLPMFDFNGLVK